MSELLKRYYGAQWCLSTKSAKISRVVVSRLSRYLATSLLGLVSRKMLMSRSRLGIERWASRSRLGLELLRIVPIPDTIDLHVKHIITIKQKP